MNLFHKIVGTFFFSGNMKFMPGTFASIIGAMVWFYIPEDTTIRMFLIFFACIIGYFSILHLLKDSDDPDPSSIVIDEIIGVWISCFFIQREIISIVIALLLFRYLDIIKPSFIYHIQNINGPLGVLLDDILCGIIVLIVVSCYYI